MIYKRRGRQRIGSRGAEFFQERAMLFPRMSTRRLMIAVAVVALACCFDWSDLWHRSPPRTLLPPMTTLYLAWAAFDGLAIVRASRPSWGFEARLAFTAIAILFLAALVAQDR